MKDAFFWLTPRSRWALYLGSTLVAIGFAFWLSNQGAALRNNVATRGVFSYEIAGSAQQANFILNSWKDQREIIWWQLVVDFGFLAVYPIAIALACAMLSASIYNPIARTGVQLSWSVLAAGPFDAIENICLLLMLSRGGNDAVAVVATFCAGIKFAFVIAGVIYVIVALVTSAGRKMRLW